MDYLFQQLYVQQLKVLICNLLNLIWLFFNLNSDRVLVHFFGLVLIVVFVLGLWLEYCGFGCKFFVCFVANGYDLKSTDGFFLFILH